MGLPFFITREDDGNGQVGRSAVTRYEPPNPETRDEVMVVEDVVQALETDRTMARHSAAAASEKRNMAAKRDGSTGNRMRIRLILCSQWECDGMSSLLAANE